tara:strand:- start:874 stop:1086 length:213 start_codon:yes stop_codon:yes gene_type:complete
MRERQVSEFPVQCWQCKEEHVIMADERDICDWQDGELIQDALPYLSASEREMLISGTCDDCWQKMFPVDY